MISRGGGSLIDRANFSIPELVADPSTPGAQSAWVLKNQGAAGGNAGFPIGLLLALTYSGSGGSATTYQLSYETLENTIIRTAMS